jgi:hypothetical protein
MTTTINASTSSGLVNTADTSGILQLQTASTAALTITAAQNVGIGTATPTDDGGYGKIVDIYGSTGGALYLHTSTATNYAFLGKYNSSTQLADSGSAGLTFATASGSTPSERMRIDSAGSVAIGSTSTASATRLTLKGAGTGSNTLFNCQDSGGNALLTIREDGVVNLPFAVSGDAHLKIQQGAVTTLGAVASSGVSIGGGGSNNHLCQIGLGYASTYQPTAISSITTTQTGNTIADLIFATRSVNTDTAPSERMRIGSTGRVYIPNAYTETTGNSANVYVDTDGRLIRATSSLKYKQNVQNATHGLTDLLKLRSVTYQGKSESDADKTFGGLIAEEVHDAGLTEFVQYAEDGSPDALAYGNMVALCVKAIQELKAINDTQAETINALTARIVALESK